MKGKITEKERRELEQRKRYWRNFREQKEEFIVDETEVEAGNIDHDVAGCNAAASKNIHGKEDFRGKEEKRKDIEYPEAISLKNSKLAHRALTLIDIQLPNQNPISQVTQTVEQSVKMTQKTQKELELTQTVNEKVKLTHEIQKELKLTQTVNKNENKRVTQTEEIMTQNKELHS